MSAQVASQSNYSVLFSQRFFDILPGLREALRAFSLVSIEDWMRSRDVLGGTDETSSPALAGREYIACFVTSEEKECDGTLHAAQIHIPVFKIDTSGRDDALSLILAHLAHALSSLLDASRRHAVREMMSTGRLRREYDDLQHKFKRLEYFVYSLGGPQVTLAEDKPPSSKTIRLKPQHMSFFTQRLSTAITGLIAAEVYVIDADAADADGYLELELTDTMGTPLRSVQLRLSNLSHGWNKFLFGDSIDCSDQEGTITLRLKGAAPDSFVDLGLSNPTALPELRLLAPDPLVTGATLAFKSWRGLAGYRVQGSDRPANGQKVQFFKPSSLPFPNMLRCTDTKMPFNPVQFWAKENAFLVHPPARGITIGSIDKLYVCNLKRVRAILHNGHREAPLLRFGLKVVPSSVSFDARTELTAGDRSSFAWTTLPANCWGELTYECNHPLTGDVDLILAAIVADGERNHMAWALFRGFSLFQGGE